MQDSKSICPVCGLKNEENSDQCAFCDLKLLKYDLITIKDIDNYKKSLSEYKKAFVIENKTLKSYGVERDNVVIPNTVEIIGDSCFRRHLTMKEVTIPAQVKSINSNSTRNKTQANNGAFELCRFLEQVHFEKKSCLEEIGRYAFFMCANLKKIDGLPDRSVFIGTKAFSGCPQSLIDDIKRHKNYIFEDGWF